MKKLPKGCGYMGNDFGAPYPDSECFGGQLWDLDACDNRGNLYEPPEFKPCPECNHEAWLEQFEEAVELEGYEAAEQGQPREAPSSLKLRYPKDAAWHARHWLKGYDECQECNNEPKKG